MVLKDLSKSEYSYISELLSNDLKKILVFDVNSKKIVLVSVKNIKESDIENLGAEFYGRVNYGKIVSIFFIPKVQSKKIKTL